MRFRPHAPLIIGPVIGSAISVLLVTGCGATSPAKPAGNQSHPTKPMEPQPSLTVQPKSGPTVIIENVRSLTLYYVSINDNGHSGPKIGCGDSIVETATTPAPYTNLVATSIKKLLANRNRITPGGLVNALYQSRLTFVRSTVTGTAVTVYLTGELHLSGACDAMRVQAQLEFTAKQAAHTPHAVIYLNGYPLSIALAMR